MKCASCGKDGLRGEDCHGYYRCYNKDCKIRTRPQIEVDGKMKLITPCAVHQVLQCTKCKEVI